MPAAVTLRASKGAPLSTAELDANFSNLAAAAAGGYTASAVAPSNPASGDRWLDLNSGITFTWVVDANSSQWVEIPVAVTVNSGFLGALALAANDIAVGTASIFTKTITQATTLTVSSVPAAGLIGEFDLEITNGGSYAVSWWPGVKWPKGTAPVLTTAGTDVLTFYTRDGGNTWRCGRAMEDSK